MQNFKAGDVVALKGLSRERMTVVSVAQDSTLGPSVVCDWFDGGGAVRGEFRAIDLVLLAEPTKMKEEGDLGETQRRLDGWVESIRKEPMILTPEDKVSLTHGILVFGTDGKLISRVTKIDFDAQTVDYYKPPVAAFMPRETVTVPYSKVVFEAYRDVIATTPCSETNPCCLRRNEYNGFGSDGPTTFTCHKSCGCHD